MIVSSFSQPKYCLYLYLLCLRLWFPFFCGPSVTLPWAKVRLGDDLGSFAVSFFTDVLPSSRITKKVWAKLRTANQQAPSRAQGAPSATQSSANASAAPGRPPGSNTTRESGVHHVWQKREDPRSCNIKAIKARKIKWAKASRIRGDVKGGRSRLHLASTNFEEFPIMTDVHGRKGVFRAKIPAQSAFQW